MHDEIRILIVEDEIIIANDIKRALQKFKYEIVDIVKSGETAIQTVESEKPNLVLVDILLEGTLDGIDITNTIQQRYNVPVIYLTAYSDQRTLNEAKLTAPYGYISKPFEDKELYSSIEMALYKFQLDQALKDAKLKIEKLHHIAIELATCESNASIFKTTAKALKEIFGISKFAFYKREKDQLVLQTEKPMKIFKPKYNIAEGIIGKIFSLDDMCICSSQAEIEAIEPSWKNIRSAIGYRIGDEDVFVAISSEEMAFSTELADMLTILFNHTIEAVKRMLYENLLKKKAVIDPLTNVYNRLYYDQSLKYEMKLAKRYDNEIGFIVIDINNLKKINDEYGHNKGDEALKFVASLLFSQARESDNVIRSGGDEFLLMLPQTGKEVEIVEKRLRKAIIDFNKKSELPFPVDFAIGSAFWNIEMNKSTEEIIEEADKKMFIDKQKSANSR